MFGIEHIEQILKKEKYKIIGNRKAVFDNVQSIENCNSSSLTYYDKKRYFNGESTQKKGNALERTAASVVICGMDIDIDIQAIGSKGIVLVDEPRNVFVKVVKRFFDAEKKRGVHKTAIVEETSTCHSSSWIGPQVYVGKNVKIGKNTVIHGNVYLYDDTQIGNNVIIHAGTVIGADGFGYIKQKTGRWSKYPQLGKVIIGNDVEIGANSSVNRGALGDTKIGRGVKVDDHVHIGHNAEISENTAICGRTVVGGCFIGKNCWIAPGCTIKEKIRIGNNCFVGIGSVVINDVEDNSYVLGVPARKIRVT